MPRDALPAANPCRAQDAAAGLLGQGRQERSQPARPKAEIDGDSLQARDLSGQDIVCRRQGDIEVRDRVDTLVMP